MTPDNIKTYLSRHVVRRLEYYKDSPDGTVDNAIRKLFLNQKPQVGIDKRIKWPESTDFQNIRLPPSVIEELDDLKEHDGQSYAFVISHLIKYYNKGRKKP